MKKNLINKVRIEGWIYEHDLELRVTKPNATNPNVEYIRGTLSVATDDACVNVIPVHFTYVTAITSKNKENTTFTTLKKIINGEAGSIVANGKSGASMVAIDTSIGLNEFFSDRSGKEELVSVKRNEGGFVHLVNSIKTDEKERNLFECDILIKNVVRVEANEEKGYPEKVTVKGAIFDYRGALLPVEFSARNQNAMDYFESLGATPATPIFTKIRGRQISETTVTRIEEESAFGEIYVKEIPNVRKDFIITWAASEPYAWDDESTMTVTELNEIITARETYLATLKQKNDEYNQKKQSAAPAPAPAASNTLFVF